MAELNLTDSRGRDAVISADSVSIPLHVRWIDEKGRQASSRKVMKATIDQDVDALVKEHGSLSEAGEAMIQGDPEVDIERVGSFMEDYSRIYIGPAKEIVHKITQWEIIHNPDGSEKDRRPKQLTDPNVAGEVPLKWTGKLLPKKQVVNRFVFSRKLQLTHVNGLTYDFLFEMAKDLEEKESLLLLGGGVKGNEPLIFRRGGTPYRAFLEGRTEGERYALIMHLSNMELKKPEETKDEE